jgi:hypothetical protein
MVRYSCLEAVEVSREGSLESQVELPIGYQEQSHKGQKKETGSRTAEQTGQEQR